jgi:hypothetical protein
LKQTPITQDHLALAIASMSILKYFPMDEIQHRVMADFLRKLCGHVEGLSWLVSQLVNRVGEWPGPAQVRGIYCTRFKPKDGIEDESGCTIPGFTPDDCEGRNKRLDAPLAIGQAEAKRLLAGIKRKAPRTLADVREDIEFQRRFAIDKPKFARFAEERIAQLESEYNDIAGMVTA